MEATVIPRKKVTDKLEKDVEGDLVKWVLRNGGETIKFTPRGSVGWPDRMVFFPDIFIWVEVKKAGKEPTSMQYYRLATLRQYGQAALWGASLDSLTNQIGEICKANRYHLKVRPSA